MAEEDLPTLRLAVEDAERTRRRGNRFCAQPGCSRTPVLVCSWDGVSKVRRRAPRLLLRLLVGRACVCSWDGLAAPSCF